ncbi:MAG: hypothetical protein AAF718_04530 [Pseudomonadota bacterium]
MRLTYAALIMAGLSAAPATAADYKMHVSDTGLREYYCQLMVTLENTGDAPLGEISGYFYAFIGTEKVGRSKGAWYLNVAPGMSAEATFETPNAPCDTIERYEFVVGACRLDAGFEEKSLCADRIEFAEPLVLQVSD